MGNKSAQQRGAIAAETIGAAGSIFATAAAANAIPVAGQFISAGLAIAGMFVKIFAGRRQKKKAEAARRLAEKKAQDAGRAEEAAGEGIQGAAPVGGQQAQQSLQGTAPVSNPQSTGFNTWGGGNAPPIQQVLNKATGVQQ